MSIALGNEKPQQLLDVEKHIWRTLFILSEATKPPEDVLNDLLNQIPWENLPPCLSTTQQVSEWFTIQATPTSLNPVNNAMDESLDYPVLPQTVKPPHSTDAENSPPSAPTFNPTVNYPQSTDAENSPPSAPTLNPTVNHPQSTDAENSPPSAPTLNPTVNHPQSMEPENRAPGDAASRELERSSTATNDFEGFGTLNKNDTDSDDEASPTESESGVEESTYRRSRRLALDRSKTSDKNLTLTSPGFPKSKKYKTTTALKRKAPTGDLSHEGSRARPIDVDALHAVLDRYPLKREPQVSETRSLNRNFADKFLRD
jgi:hypothetical protein